MKYFMQENNLKKRMQWDQNFVQKHNNCAIAAPRNTSDVIMQLI